jgi:outer membrane receptor protein involved in Fe transport
VFKHSIAALVAVCVSVALAPHAHSQSRTSGAIAGVVKDQATKTPLQGVTIVATSPQLLQQQQTTTDASGSYKMTNLPPGTYLLSFTYFGVVRSMKGVTVLLNRTTAGHFTMDLTTATETRIEFEGRLGVDTTKTDRGIVMDTDFIDKVPIPGGGFGAALIKAPGAQYDGVGISQSGSSGIENRYSIDGIDVTGLAYGTIGSPLARDFVEQIEIITGGYNAEYGRSTGAVVNVVTKSGSNEFHGSVWGKVTPGLLVATRDATPSQASSIDAETNLAFDSDFGFDLGGPIVKDKVWFYVGFSPRFQRNNVDRITKRRTDCRTTQPDGTQSQCEPLMYGDGVPDEDPDTGFYITDELDRERLVRDQTVYQFVSKINYAMSPEHQGQVSLIGVPISGETVGVAGVPSATRFDYTQLTTDMAAKWTSKFNNNKTEVEAVVGWHRSTFEADSIDNAMNDQSRQNLYFGNLGTWGMLGHESEATMDGCVDSAADDIYPFIQNCPDEGRGYAIGGPGSIADDSEERFSARFGATQRVKAAGNHEIKAGLDIEDNRMNKVRNLSGGAYYDVLLAPYNQTNVLRWVQLAPPGDTTGQFDNVCRDSNSGEQWDCEHLGPTDVLGRTVNWAAYMRDSWQLRPNFTVNIGLRYEEQRLRFAEHLQDTTDPFTGSDLGKNAMELTNMWSPRLGVLYDWTKEGRSKIYGHWGRFYESIPMDINDRSFGGETLYQQSYDSTSQCGPMDDGIGGPDGPSCVTDPNQVPSLGETLFGSGVLVAPGIKAQYMDEYLIGAEYELVEDLTVGVAFQNRSLGRVLEDVSTDNADTYIIANPGEWSASDEADLVARIAATSDPDERALLENQLEQFRGIRTFDKPRRDYDSLQLTAVRRFSRGFYLQGSYTYSRTRGNFPGLFSPDNGQLDPNISSQFDLIELLSNRDGPLPQDRPHNIKLDGWYTFDFERQGELTFGVSGRALSGAPVDALGRHYLYGFGESFVLPRGAMGRTDFDFGMDLRLTYGRRMVRGTTLEIYADLFNVFNRQGAYSLDEDFTFDSVNPIVGGEYEDLIWAKAQNTQGGEQSTPIGRNRNFLNPNARYSPFSARVGARLTF